MLCSPVEEVFISPPTEEEERRFEPEIMHTLDSCTCRALPSSEEVFISPSYEEEVRRFEPEIMHTLDSCTYRALLSSRRGIYFPLL